MSYWGSGRSLLFYHRVAQFSPQSSSGILTKPHHKPHPLPVRRKLIVQALSVKQHFHGVEADAATASVLLRAARAAIKRVEDVLELLFGERCAGVFDGEFMLATSNFYHTAGVAVAYRV